MKEYFGQWADIDDTIKMRTPLKHNPLCGGYRVDICEMCAIDTTARAAKAVEEELFQILSKDSEMKKEKREKRN